jgi:CRISPR-associated exonuclease Cas4
LKLSIYVKPIERITPVLYEKYVKEELHRLEELKNPKIIYVTDLVGCSHKYYLRRLYPELTVKFEPSAILGNLVHAGIEALLKEKGFEVEVEVSAEVEVNGDKYSVKGRVDALKKDEGLVVEVKTARYAQDIPREHHLNQLKIYLEMLNLENGLIIYITPDKIHEFQIKRDRINLESLVKTLVEDTAHPRYEWECNYCMFKKLCPYAVERSD